MVTENNHKKKILFIKVEAGMGHIIPLNSIYETFLKKYGDQFEISCINPYAESKFKSMQRFNNMFVNQVKKHNKCHLYGHFSTAAMDFFGTRLSSMFIMRWIAPGVLKRTHQFFKESEADVIVSGHWAPIYYAHKMKNRPLTIVYSPDVLINKLFSYPSDLVLTPVDVGYEKAIRKHRFNEDNLKLVSTCINNSVFEINSDKCTLRKELGINTDKFTIILADGGYGIGKTEKIVSKCIKENLDINIICVCGKNKELYERLNNLSKENKSFVNLYQVSFENFSIKYIACSDLFLGKCGANVIAEASYFGIPSIVTSCATNIEDHNRDYYVKYVKCAKYITNIKKIVNEVKKLSADSEEMKRLSENALKIHSNFGCEKAVNEIYKFLLEAK